MTLTDLQTLFPRGANSSTVGRIPMSFVNAHLAEIKAIVKAEGLRRIYRGERFGHNSTWTNLSSAKTMLLYRK